jgi:hypothetical protein
MLIFLIINLFNRIICFNNSHFIVIVIGVHFEGGVIAKPNITFKTNTSTNGQLYTQTAVTLDANIIVKP